MFHWIAYCFRHSFKLIEWSSTGSLHISHNLLSLLVTQQFKSQLVFHQSQRTVTSRNNSRNTHYQHTVTFATLIQTGYFTSLCRESPSQSFLSTSDTTDTMFRTIQIVSIQKLITSIFSISYHLLQCRVRSDKLAEFIVCLAVSFFAELYRTFNNGYFIFIFNSLLIHHLYNDICLCQVQVGHFVLAKSSDCIHILQVVTIQLCTFVVSRRNPGSLTGLTILLSDFSKVCTTFDGSIDTVSQSFCLRSIFSNHLYLTVLNRVCHWSSSQFLERVDRIVSRIVVRTIYTTYWNRIQTSSYIGRQCLRSIIQINVRNFRTGSTNKCRIITRSTCKLFSIFHYFLLDSISVFRACSYLYINKLDVTSFHILFELLFLLVISCFQICICDGHCRVYDWRIRNGSQQHIRLIRSCIESILSFYRIREKRLWNQSLIFLSQTSLNQLFLKERPELVHRLIIFCILCRHLRCIHLRVIYEELLQHIFVESTSLRITERGLLQHRVYACINDWLEFCFRNWQTKFFCFVFNQLIVNVVSPNFIFNLIVFFICECTCSSGKFHNFSIFFYQALIILSGKWLSVNLSYIMWLVWLQYLPCVSRNESEQRQTNNNHQ